MNGNNIIVYVLNGSTWSAIAATKSDTLKVDGDQIEICSQSEQSWRQYMAGRSGWSLSAMFLVTEVADLRKVLSVNTRVKLRIGARTFSSSTGLEGYAIIKSMDIGMTRGGLAQGNIQFLGDGSLT